MRNIGKKKETSQSIVNKDDADTIGFSFKMISKRDSWTEKVSGNREVKTCILPAFHYYGFHYMEVVISTKNLLNDIGDQGNMHKHMRSV